MTEFTLEQADAGLARAIRHRDADNMLRQGNGYLPTPAEMQIVAEVRSGDVAFGHVVAPAGAIRAHIAEGGPT